MLLPTLPLFAKSLNGSDVALGWIVGSTTVASLIVRPFSGVIIDKMGRKGILIAGLFIIMLVTLAFGWLPSVGAIIAVRFMHGIGWGMASTASSTIASDNIPKNRFAEGMGYFSLSNSLAMALAPSVALAIFAGYGFKPISFLSAGLTVAVLLLAFFIRNTHKVEQQETKSKLSIYERTSITPSIIMFFVSATYGSITGFLALYATKAGIQNIGLFFAVYATTLLLARPLSGKLTDRFGFSITMYPGLLLLTIAMLLLSIATTLPIFLVCAAVYGLGLGSVQSICYHCSSSLFYLFYEKKKLGPTETGANRLTAKIRFFPLRRRKTQAQPAKIQVFGALGGEGRETGFTACIFAVLGMWFYFP
ncbi:MAG: major facilitator transporter [Paenibacillaceae bacterium]|nr:major facilitator transporter [Paenibacillaceae bacterium]